MLIWCRFCFHWNPVACREPPRLSLVEFNKQTKKEIKDERNLLYFPLLQEANNE